MPRRRTRQLTDRPETLPAGMSFGEFVAQVAAEWGRQDDNVEATPKAVPFTAFIERSSEISPEPQEQRRFEPTIYKFSDFLRLATSGEFERNFKSLDNIYKLEDKKARYIEFVVELFGFNQEQAEQAYEQTLRMTFERAVGRADAVGDAEASLAETKPLCVPAGEPEKYQGKGKSGEIYAFLQRVYQHRESAEPLGLGWLRENDPKALSAFRGRRKLVPPPPELLVLTDPERGSKQENLLAKHDIDLSTPEGRAEGKKIMSAISNLIYDHR